MVISAKTASVCKMPKKGNSSFSMKFDIFKILFRNLILLIKIISKVNNNYVNVPILGT